MATMRHLRLHSTNLTYTDSVPEKQELHRNKTDEGVKIKLILLDVSDDTCAAGRGARVLLGPSGDWRYTTRLEVLTTATLFLCDVTSYRLCRDGVTC